MPQTISEAATQTVLAILYDGLMFLLGYAIGWYRR
jgi:hypothetical protein